MPARTDADQVAERIAALDWPAMHAQLDRRGFAVTGTLLDDSQTHSLAALYDADAGFRSTVVMQRHGFGQGEYKYFDHPLPDVVGTLRRQLYPHLAEAANRWATALGEAARYPAGLDQMLARCHAAGQNRPTPLLLRYGAGDYNCLHQDLYGDEVFPLQATLLLSDPASDFDGGEFVLVEQRPRMQSRPQVVRLKRGEAVLFAVRQRPVRGGRGYYRVNLRHGVSEIRHGRRLTAGIIFHDAA